MCNNERNIQISNSLFVGALSFVGVRLVIESTFWSRGERKLRKDLADGMVANCNQNKDTYFISILFMTFLVQPIGSQA